MAALIHTINPISISSNNSLSKSQNPSIKIPSFHTQNPISQPNFFQLLKLSTHYKDTHLTKTIHASLLKQHKTNTTHLFNFLITCYIQLGNFNYARKLFDEMSSPDIVSYTAMVSGLAKCEAVRLFIEMREAGVEPNEYTLVAILSRVFELGFGLQVLGFSVKCGFVECSYVVNALMGLFGKCGEVELAVKLFEFIRVKDRVSWNTIISCLVKEGCYDRVFELRSEMEEREDYFTLSSLIIACARSFDVRRGVGIHGYAVKIGYGGHLSVNNALIEFYAKCGGLEDVERLFERMSVRDSFTWHEMVNAYMGFGLVDMAASMFYEMPEKSSFSYNALLSGFCQNGDGFSAWKIFCRLVERRIELTDFTLSSVLNACGLMKDKRTSEQIHAFIIKFGFGSNNHVETALLHMCTRCGRMDDAETIFRRIGKENSIMLTSMVCAYARTSEPEKAISLVCNEHSGEQLVMDEVTLASTLSVCGDLGVKEIGEQFHCQALKNGFLCETGVGNAMVSMYSNCGDIGSAMNFFDTMPSRDLVSWNGLLTGHIINRQGEEALTTWQNMQNRGVKPDSITCHLVISAYRYTKSNLVESCLDFFASIKLIYLIEPDVDHYVCLISVLGCWGFMEEAEEIIDKMPFEPNAPVWRALLDSGRIHGDAVIERRAVKKILDMDPQDPSTYILKSNLYSASGLWHCSEVVREEMRDKGFKKFPGRSWLVHENKTHSFFSRDKLHSQCKDIYSALEILFLECLKAGYVPDSSFVLHEVEEHQKINFLLYHSVKLAVVYGILVSRPGKPVKVMKNIHLCGDCHAFFKCVSVITKREIHVRDSSGFHCFANGECSCRD